MHITRLRLHGFKSFVEPAELHIERGLTGVVGPNGCGKSNLLEALRWVMGETSYKNMRASSMEDVIFSGTNVRPARNIAEVTIALDNRDRKAHPAFNEDDNLEITRRIERDSGSEYRINGKPVRARDVQLLFADASTGAHSPALVQQGRIGEIVSAKPARRRFILEEAAGITGLHSRRHEAEIKLRGAENNLERLQDIIGQMDANLTSLRRQERQVVRYREISRELERLQILQLHSDYLNHLETFEQAQEEHQAALDQVGEKTALEAETRKLQLRAADELPKLREREMVTAAIMQRLNIESDQLEREQQKRQERKDELVARCAQIDADLAREQQKAGEDHQRLDDFNKELAGLEQTTRDDEQSFESAAQAVEQARISLSKGETGLQEAGTLFAEQKALSQALHREQQEKQSSATALAEKVTSLDREQGELRAQLEKIADFDELGEQIGALGDRLLASEKQLVAHEQELESLRENENSRLHNKMQAESRADTMLAEITTLEKLLHTPVSGDERPVLEDIAVTPGYETALGAALGDDLEASLNNEAGLFWGDLEDRAKLPDLPGGTTPLLQLVTAPLPLAQRLWMTGIVERGEGDELQKLLAPGQRLVSVEGDVWRWDGFTTRADAPTNAARRLAQKNHLDELQNEFETVRGDHTRAEELFETARQNRALAQDAFTGLKKRLTHERLEFERTRKTLEQAERSAASHKARLQAITATMTELNERQTRETSRLEELLIEISRQRDLTVLQKMIEQQTQEIDRLRTNYLEAKAKNDSLELMERNRLARINGLQNEIKRTTTHLQQGEEQVKTLRQRARNDRVELEKLGDLPEQADARRQSLNSELNKAGQQRQQAADELQEAENTLREIERSLREHQTKAGDARERRAACDARLEAAKIRLHEQEQLISSELHCTPDECPQKAGLDEHETLPAPEELERRLAKLNRDRERLGSVNLRAEMEARELAGKISEMSAEHDDLIAAIEALRTAISGLNREGRRRLLSAFNEINGHFESLFTSLFGGGKARLQLVESDDPLQAGLEIIASPPGKKPQVLTLLSGGEKALTALSLIFAVFLTNPAPICVLDEVDAPLDDANVERFCTLLDEMTKKTDTRFLVITHHPTTMSHMNRLFGVTMAEKGVSQMVSVDLSTAEAYNEAARVS